MRKRMMALFLAIVFCITGMIVGQTEAKAAEVEWDVDISSLLTEDTLYGYLVNQTRGVYLAEGYSFINDGGGGRVGCGGVTNAAARCKVSVNANLEKKVSGSWVHVTSCFPDSSAGKESTCNAGDFGSIPGLGRST